MTRKKSGRNPSQSGRNDRVSDRLPAVQPVPVAPAPTQTTAPAASHAPAVGHAPAPAVGHAPAPSSNASAISRPSEFAHQPLVRSSSSSTALVAHAPELQRPALPAPPKIQFHGGDPVTLVVDQLYADRVMIRKGERGRVMYPSSQAAAWVVHFPRIGPKYRVVPEPMLTRA